MLLAILSGNESVVEVGNLRMLNYNKILKTQGNIDF